MSEVKSVELPILDEWGHERGRVKIAILPSSRYQRTPRLLIDTRGETQDLDDDLESVRLVEAAEYVYVIDVPNARGPFDTDHPEMFFADTEFGDRGRLRTGEYTGAVDVTVIAASKDVGKICFEVQSTKLDYMSDYRWMLRDIAEACTDLVMDRFAASAARFSVDDSHDSETLYQRFSFLRSLLERDEFQAAIGRILAAPYVTWEEVEDVAWQARGLRPSSRIARSIVRPGPRAWSTHVIAGDLDSIPQPMVVPRMETTLDNLPNRFIKWVLREWLTMIGRVSSALELSSEASPFARRGKREIAGLRKKLEAILEDGLFRDIGELTMYPGASQVLQKREGYRYFLAAHVQFEAAARLYWPGMDYVYRAGQRNVAKLYEYWVYLQLGMIVARLCGHAFDSTRLIEPTEDGLVLRLRYRDEAMVTGTIERLGRTIRLELWYNKSFGASRAGVEGSWTRPLRPDCSLLAQIRDDAKNALATWIHFDAKYRIENAEETFGKADDDDSVQTNFRREDLLKMHAYKDAIRKSSGAYIIYPGTDGGNPFRQYHELLPGLGAFTLRPSADGESIGSFALSSFIENVLTHLALQATQHERARYWTARAYAGPPVEARVPAVPFIVEPPADVLVLLGYAKNASHRVWIAHSLMYNLRADAHRGGAVGIDSRELAAHLLVVYGDDMDIDIYKIVDVPRIMTAQQLASMDYPEPRGRHYFCYSLQCVGDERQSKWLTRSIVERVRMRMNPQALVGAPVVVTWLDLCAEAQFDDANTLKR
ncbi:MAG: DUF2357 domain-containing protein [Polyangiaceae bacterium]|nr:DUF2357 domain-containing protein [Polyangiaceae bacterium]